MFVTINDDFDLKKIEVSGQCFRVKELENGIFRFITGNNVLYIRAVADAGKINTADICDNKCFSNQDTTKKYTNNVYEVSCTLDEWEQIWTPYFDLNRDYKKIRNQINKQDEFLLNASASGAGIRILKQDPFEMLLTFIISQQKQIPSIKKCVEALAIKYGHVLRTNVCIDNQTIKEELYSFPTSDEIKDVSIEDIRDIALGYRDSYIVDAVNRVNDNRLNLNYIGSLSDEDLLKALMSVKGVGVKVANCVALFAYSRVALAPIDTWIKKVIEQKYGGVNPFPLYGENAGIMQQYIFYFATQNKGEF